MYLDYLVDIPEVKDKITFRSKGNARYVYYEYDRIYDPSKNIQQRQVHPFLRMKFEQS